jgi:hypothetical protein
MTGMETRRGPDYAYDLTETERRTLDMLVDRIESGVPAPIPLRRRRSPFVSAAAAAVVVMTMIGSIWLLARPRQPAPPADAHATLEQLAVAAASAAPGRPSPRLTTEVLVEDPAGSCTVGAVTTSVTTGHLAVRSATVPAGVAAQAGCSGDPRVDPAPQPSFDRDTPDPAAKWTQLRATIRALPPWVETVDASGDLSAALRRACAAPTTTDCTGTWWTLLTGVLADPGTTGAVRAEALRLALASGEATMVPAVTTDVTGRPGVTVRVPHPDATTADLTFDPGTGALLQRAVTEDGGSAVRFTVYPGGHA